MAYKYTSNQIIYQLFSNTIHFTEYFNPTLKSNNTLIQCLNSVRGFSKCIMEILLCHSRTCNIQKCIEFHRNKPLHNQLENLKHAEVGSERILLIRIYLPPFYFNLSWKNYNFILYWIYTNPTINSHAYKNVSSLNCEFNFFPNLPLIKDGTQASLKQWWWTKHILQYTIRNGCECIGYNGKPQNAQNITQYTE